VTKLQVREYEIEDFTNIELSDEERQFRVGQPVDGWAVVHKMAGPSWTAVDTDDQIVFSGGVHDILEGVGEIWITVSVLAAVYPGMLVAAKSLFASVSKNYRRIQAAVDPTWPGAVSLARHFGFRYEGTMRRSGPHGEDQMLLALVKGA
jgi:hypothetical protein